jgi:hypothetical protein
MRFISEELAHAGQADAQASIDQADAFFGGSPTEFLGESLLALQALQNGSSELPQALRAFVAGLADEIAEGFRRA